MTDAKPTVGFIGLGTMGLPMARNLLKGGVALKGFDLNGAALDALAQAGGTVARDPAAAATGVGFVITMLPNAPHVRAALFEGNGAASAMRGDTLYIDMSTIHPLESDAIAGALNTRGIAMIDAPVGRTSVEAENGTLLIMAGGDAAHIERARPIFSLMGNAIVHCGPQGMGARMKIVNNFLSTSLNVLTAETLSLAEATGLGLDITMKVLMSTAAGRGHLATTYPGKVLAGNLAPGFMIDLAHKDLGLGLDLAASCNVPTPMAAAARETYSLARASGLGRQDWTAVYEMYRGLGAGRRN